MPVLCYRTIRYTVNVRVTEHGSYGFETLREYRRAGMLLREKPNRLESGLADGGYTFFGRFFDDLLESRGYNQSTFAAECRRRKFKVGRPGKQRDVGQRSISDWMRGLTVCPREIPTYADAILVLSDTEWTDFGLSLRLRADDPGVGVRGPAGVQEVLPGGALRGEHRLDGEGVRTRKPI